MDRSWKEYGWSRQRISHTQTLSAMGVVDIMCVHVCVCVCVCVCTCVCVCACLLLLTVEQSEAWTNFEGGDFAKPWQ